MQSRRGVVPVDQGLERILLMTVFIGGFILTMINPDLPCTAQENQGKSRSGYRSGFGVFDQGLGVLRAFLSWSLACGGADNVTRQLVPDSLRT